MTPFMVTIEPPPRGGSQGMDPAQFQAQSMRGSFSWGGAPAMATLVYPNFSSSANAGLYVGGAVRFWIGRHYFSGICKDDRAVSSSRGQMRTLQFADLREFLSWDWIFGCFNKPDVRLVGGRRVKRWKHMYPADYRTYSWRFTDSPLMGWQILQAVFLAPTVGTSWIWDLTGNGLFPAGLLNGPVFDIDCLGGMRLDALLNLICEKTGLVFCHDPIDTPFQNTDYRLVFTRKGYGLLPIPFPENADDQSLGFSLSNNATNICVLGDRNKYQVLEVPMEKDWSPAWEQFLDLDLLAQDIFLHEKNPKGDPTSGVATPTAYNGYATDPDRWQGAGDAKVRAMEITVSEYAALRNARSAGSGNAFLDNRKFAGRWRNDLPAALYLDKILFRAFKPNPPLTTTAYVNGVATTVPAIRNRAGLLVPLTSAEISDQLLCRVYVDPVAGTMTASPSEPVDGNGVFICKGYQVGEDLFRLVKPDRMNVNFFSPNSRLWAQVNFQIDDSGEGVRFVIADQPVFVQDDAHPLLVTVDDKVVLNAQFKLASPSAKAALVFEAERYQYWQGTYPNVSKDRVENVGGLNGEWLVDAAGNYQEIVYSNYQTADQKAASVADYLLLAQYFYLSGGYNLKWDSTNQKLDEFGTLLAPGTSSCFDRIEITNGPGGCLEVVDFTTERQRDRFEPERELDRRSIQNSLFPGQQELRVERDDQQRFNTAIRKMPPALFALFQKLLKGEVDENLHYTMFTPGTTAPTTISVGMPIAGNPEKTTATPPSATVAGTDTKFIGVTVRHNESGAFIFGVQTSGDTVARVKGPVAVNGVIGLAPTNGADHLAAGGSPAVGAALEAIADDSVKTINVRLGTGGSSETPPPSSAGAYMGIYDYGTAYKGGAIVLVNSTVVVGGVTLTPGVYALRPTLSTGPYPTGNAVPQFPIPTSGTIYWDCLALGIQAVTICSNGPAQVYINASNPF